LRVEAEIVRDLYLAASGLLARKIGGPSVYPPLPPEVAAISYANNFKWKASVGEDLYRRGLYTFFKRTAPYPDLMVFDCPDANVTAIRRSASNTPLQALTTLNGETFIEAARALARPYDCRSERRRRARCRRIPPLPWPRAIVSGAYVAPFAPREMPGSIQRTTGVRGEASRRQWYQDD
jgi:hypothetical protein